MRGGKRQFQEFQEANKAPFRALSFAFSIAAVFAAMLFTCIQLASAATISGTIYDLTYEPALEVVVSVNSTPEQIYLASEGRYSFYLPPGNYLLSATYGQTGNLKSESKAFTIVDDGNYTIDFILFDDIISPDDPANEGQEVDVADSADSFSGSLSNPLLTSLLVILAVVVVFAAVMFAAWFSLKRHTSTLASLEKTVSSFSSTKRHDGSHDAHYGPDNHAAHSPKSQPPEPSSPEKSGGDAGRKEKKGKKEKQDLPAALLDFLDRNEGRATQKEIRKEILYSEAKISLLISRLEAEGKVKRIKKGRGNIIVKS